MTSSVVSHGSLRWSRFVVSHGSLRWSRFVVSSKTAQFSDFVFFPAPDLGAGFETAGISTYRRAVGQPLCIPTLVGGAV
jgi:hypothetical protein